ncbi:MAG: acetylglutamate kinase [Planctomycetota bacterium]|nr:MAG: acetylglutamate kinase [Planctomycetota bacterium]
MEKAIEKADVLIEALRWIRQFRGKITVLKLGGSVMEDAQAMTHLLLDILFMETVGMQPVVVHGGGAAISRAMKEAGINARFVEGRRYTDQATLEIVERVLAQEVNERLARQIEDLGGRAKALNFRTKPVLFGRRLELRDRFGQPVDLGFVGEVTRVDADTIRELCADGVVPIIPSMCLADDGTKLNVNADTAAMAVAKSLAAEKLVFLSDVNGVRMDKDDPDTLIHTLTAAKARELIKQGVIESGMIPKVQACLEILDQGVNKIHIVDGRLRHSLLLEVYTSKGVGTEIVRDVPEDAVL